jgi:glutamine synthetase adenylyltransferase
MSSASDLCARVLSLGVVEEKSEITALSISLGEPGLERLSRELAERSPLLAETLAANVGDAALRGLRRFLTAASTGEQRIRSAVENCEWIERALPVFAQSAMANGILSCHPEDIVALFRDREPEAERTVSDQLRIAARRSMLRVAGRTLLEGRSIWETMRWYSETFDRIVEMALAASGPPEGFGVFALGRLGTCELDVFSDADLVFLHGTDCDAEEAGRCAQAVVEMLSGYTREGSAIQVDTRLRPHGTEGSLAVSLRQLEQYCESGAKPWEVLAFAKLRRIAGDAWMVEKTEAQIAMLRRRFASSPEFAAELRSMRQRIADSGTAENVKTAPGGLYDLDFCLGLLEARGQLPSAGRQLPERIAALHRHQLLTAPQASVLHRAAELFRLLEHAVRVVEGRQRKWLPESDTLRRRVEGLVGRTGLEQVLREQMAAVRAVYDLLLGAC